MVPKCHQANHEKKERKIESIFSSIKFGIDLVLVPQFMVTKN
jgi:hypothetical protein